MINNKRYRLLFASSVWKKYLKLFIFDPVLMPHEVAALTVSASLQTLPLPSLQLQGVNCDLQ
jgi:hypothetical protein